MKRLITCTLSVLGALVAAGCDGCNKTTTAVEAGTAATGDGAIAPIATDYPMKPALVPLASRFCEAMQALPGLRTAECCATPPSALLVDECTRLLSISLTDGVVKVDEAKLGVCEKAMKDSLVGCDWVVPSSPPLPEACKGLIAGQLGEKARCRSNLDCRAPLHCGDGFCRGLEPVGSVCGRGVDAFATSTRQTDADAAHPVCAYCSLISHKCEPVPEAGAMCFANTNCAKGQLCIEGKCTEAVAGKRDEACAGTTCDEGLRCVDKKCVPLAATGETCERDFDCAKGGCSAADGGRVCGMTCTHVGDLDAIRKVLSKPIPRPSASAR